MNRILILLCLALSLGLTACGSTVTVRVEPDPTTTIKITDAADSSVTISEPGAKGAINMHVGDQLHYKITKILTKQNGHTVTTDVTSQADFNFSNPPVAAMDVTGQLTAFVPGFTTLEVVYREDRADPTRDDKVALDITVTP